MYVVAVLFGSCRVRWSHQPALPSYTDCTITQQQQQPRAYLPSWQPLATVHLPFSVSRLSQHTPLSGNVNVWPPVQATCTPSLKHPVLIVFTMLRQMEWTSRVCSICVTPVTCLQFYKVWIIHSLWDRLHFSLVKQAADGVPCVGGITSQCLL